MSLILTFGLQLIVVRLAIFFFTGDYRSVQPSYAGFSIPRHGSYHTIRPDFHIRARRHSHEHSLLVHGAYTHGSGHSATRMDLDSAQLMGVDIGKIYAITYGIGAAAAATAGSS